MLGTVIKKENFDAKLYAQCADWCNSNSAFIAEHDDVYIVETIPTMQPTKAEQIAEIRKYYDARFSALDQALIRRRLANGSIEDLQAQYKALQSEMLTKIKGVK
nr:MAG TPA: hypothetical protein [Caudoviricetes sp.]